MQQGIIEKNHMDILWHDYALNKEDTIPITEASLIEKASIVGRTGMMLLSCGTGAWRVRSSMNTLSRELGKLFFTVAVPDQYWRQHLETESFRELYQ